MKTQKRKSEHIEICLKENVGFKNKKTLLEDVSFEGVELVYQAVPEKNKKEINTETTFLGKTFSFPLMVEAMTGGCKEAKKINKDIALACERVGIGFGLGSMRAMIENEKLSETYFVRDLAPNIFLSGNIGILQLKEFSFKEIEKAMEKIKVDAIAVHLNAAQEALQKDGSTDFSGCLEKLKEFSGKIKIPVYVKEVGHGISKELVEKLNAMNIKAIDVAGAGGTSWTGIDSLRGNKELGKRFWDWGIPTAASILEAKSASNKPVIASGGIRSGIDVVKAIALGAKLGGIALPVLKAQNRGGSKGVEDYLKKIKEEIITAMFLIGAKNIEEIKNKEVILSGKLKEWKKQRKL